MAEARVDDDEVVHVRVSGTETRCRQLLETIGQVADVTNIEGPHRNRRGPEVRLYATARLRA